MFTPSIPWTKCLVILEIPLPGHSVPRSHQNLGGICRDAEPKCGKQEAGRPAAGAGKVSALLLAGPWTGSRSARWRLPESSAIPTENRELPPHPQRHPARSRSPLASATRRPGTAAPHPGILLPAGSLPQPHDPEPGPCRPAPHAPSAPVPAARQWPGSAEPAPTRQPRRSAPTRPLAHRGPRILRADSRQPPGRSQGRGRCARTGHARAARGGGKSAGAEPSAQGGGGGAAAAEGAGPSCTCTGHAREAGAGRWALGTGHWAGGEPPRQSGRDPLGGAGHAELRPHWACTGCWDVHRPPRAEIGSGQHRATEPGKSSRPTGPCTSRAESGTPSLSGALPRCGSSGSVICSSPAPIYVCRVACPYEVLGSLTTGEQ